MLRTLYKPILVDTTRSAIQHTFNLLRPGLYISEVLFAHNSGLSSDKFPLALASPAHQALLTNLHRTISPKT
jgi:hypothetical protein